VEDNYYSVEYFLKKFGNATTAELEEILYKDPAEYRSEVIQAVKKLIDSRADRTVGISNKYCPVCKRLVLNETELCNCGYNFVKPNLTSIAEIHSVRAQKSKSFAVGSIIIAIAMMCFYWPVNLPPEKKVFELWYYGLPSLLIMHGVYRLISGKNLRRDGILSQFTTYAGKDVDEDLPYILCPKCKKQILIELEHSRCPSCNTLLSGEGKFRTKEEYLKWKAIRLQELNGQTSGPAAGQPSIRESEKK